MRTATARHAVRLSQLGLLGLLGGTAGARARCDAPTMVGTGESTRPALARLHGGPSI
jgi:hypothetical protein